MATIISSYDRPNGLMIGIDDPADHNTQAHIILGVGCDDIQTSPDDNTHPYDAPAGDKLRIYDGNYGATPFATVEIYSLEPLGVLKWLDDVRSSVATTACYHYERLKRDAHLGDEQSQALAEFERGAAYNGYRIVEDENANGGCRLETMPFDEWYPIRFPEA